VSVNLRQKRFIEGVNRILQEELQNGNLPTSKEFAVRLNRFLRQQDLSAPEYTFKRARNGEIASSSFYNNTVEKIQRDLQILYENTIAMHDVISDKFDWFEVEKNRLEYEVSKLKNELAEKVALYGKTGYITSLFDTFDDHSKIEKEDNVVVDIKKHQVSLKQEENTSYVINPACKISFNMPKDSMSTFKRIPISGNIENILLSSNVDSYQEVWLAKEKGMANAYIEIDFEESQQMNRIEINIHTLRSCNIYVEFTGDGHNYFHLPYYDCGVGSKGENFLNFPTTTIKTLRIWLRKQESDKEIVHPEGYQYEYLFGIKTIAFYHLSYPSEGTLITKAMEPHSDSEFSIGKVTLITEEELPDGTDIEYYIRLNPEDSWRQISPLNRESINTPNLIDYKHIVESSPIELGTEENRSPQESEIMELQANGISFYSIGTIEKKKIISRTERMYAGKNAYGVRYAEEDLGETHIPTLQDWENTLADIHRTIKTTEEGKRGLLIEGDVFKKHTQLYFEMGMYSEEKETIISTIPTSTEPIAIFLNGEKVFEGIPSSQTHVNYKIKSGWNDLVVLVYIQNLEKPITLDIGFDPLTVTTYCYSSSKPLEKISVFDLQYNTKNNDWSKYALYEIEDKIYVVINHLLPGVKYDLFFNYIDQVEHKEIQMKIAFKQNHIGQYTTPVLKRYTLQFN